MGDLLCDRGDECGPPGERLCQLVGEGRQDPSAAALLLTIPIRASYRPAATWGP